MRQDLSQADTAFKNGLKAGIQLATQIIDREMDDTLKKKYIIAKIKKEIKEDTHV